MKHVSILVPRGAAALSCIEGSFIMFTKVNDFLANRGQEPLFKVQLVGLTREPEVYDHLFSVRPDATIAGVRKTDLIIIPAVNGDKREVIAANRPFLPWMARQHKSGAEVASLCVGAFLLAAAGLLEGRSCTTHWSAADEFRKMFPRVKLRADTIITDEGGIYSSGGALSFWNLLIYLVEKYTDREMAIFASKFYEIEIDRDSQSNFLIFNGQKDHQDDSVKKVQQFIEGNYHDRITVGMLCAMFAVGRRSLERRFKQATGNTVSEYIQRVKIEAAKKSFERSRKNINEVMYEVGYSDTKAFPDGLQANHEHVAHGLSEQVSQGNRFGLRNVHARKRWSRKEIGMKGANTLGIEFLKELEAESASSRKCLERIPVSLYDWKPHEKSMPLGYLSLIVAEIPLWIWQMVETPDIDFAKFEHFRARTTAELVHHFDENMTKARSALSNTSDETLAEPFSLKNNGQVLVTLPRKDNIGSTINHLVHHRGQLTVYMRLNNLPVPSIYGPSADDRGF